MIASRIANVIAISTTMRMCSTSSLYLFSLHMVELLLGVTFSECDIKASYTNRFLSSRLSSHMWHTPILKSLLEEMLESLKY